MKKLSAMAATSMLATLAACGGGDGTAPPPGSPPPTAPPVTSAVPASASASVDGFVGYLTQLVVAAADTLSPVDVSAVTPPVSDTTEPAPVN